MNKKPTAKYQIADTFKITGRGLVFAGQILEGQISHGDFIEFPFKNELRRRKIIGIEGMTTAHPEKVNTGLLIKCESPDEIDEIRNSPLKNILTSIYKADT